MVKSLNFYLFLVFVTFSQATWDGIPSVPTSDAGYLINYLRCVHYNSGRADLFVGVTVDGSLDLQYDWKETDQYHISSVSKWCWRLYGQHYPIVLSNHISTDYLITELHNITDYCNWHEELKLVKKHEPISPERRSEMLKERDMGMCSVRVGLQGI